MERGDPQLVAAPVFTIGSIALAFQLVDYVGQAAVGAPLAIILGCTGIFLLASTLWAAYAGQSFVACFAGTFGGFWIGYGLLVLALIHGWFAIPPEDIQRTVATFAIAFAAFFLFLALASLRLPIIYFLIFILVVAALCFVAAAYLHDDPVDDGPAQGRRLHRLRVRGPRHVAVVDRDEPVPGRPRLPAPGPDGHQAAAGAARVGARSHPPGPAAAGPGWSAASASGTRAGSARTGGGGPPRRAGSRSPCPASPSRPRRRPR